MNTSDDNQVDDHKLSVEPLCDELPLESEQQESEDSHPENVVVVADSSSKSLLEMESDESLNQGQKEDVIKQEFTDSPYTGLMSSVRTFHDDIIIYDAVSILPDCQHVVFNTAQINSQATIMEASYLASKTQASDKPTTSSLVLLSDWNFVNEPVGISKSNAFKKLGLLEQINMIADNSDYLWYSISIELNGDESFFSCMMQSNIHVDFEDDVEYDAVVLFLFDKIAARFTDGETNELCCRMGTLMFATSNLKHEQGKLIVCSTRNDSVNSPLHVPLEYDGSSLSVACSESFPDEYFFQLHYRTCVQGNTFQHDYSISLREVDLHIYPRICIVLERFFNRINAKYFSSTSVVSSLEVDQDDYNFDMVGVKHLNNDPGPHFIIYPAFVLENGDKVLKEWCQSFSVISFRGTGRIVYSKELNSMGKASLPPPFNLLLSFYSLFEWLKGHMLKRKGSSSYIFAVFPYIDGNPILWNITFTPTQVEDFSMVITKDFSGDTDLSLHFSITVGLMRSPARLPLWMDFSDEFVAETKAYLLVHLRDSFEDIFYEDLQHLVSDPLEYYDNRLHSHSTESSFLPPWENDGDIWNSLCQNYKRRRRRSASVSTWIIF